MTVGEPTMSEHETTQDEGSDFIGFRAPESLRERIDNRVDAEDEHDTRSELIREACRQYVLGAEVREHLDVEETTTQSSFADGGEGA